MNKEQQITEFRNLVAKMEEVLLSKGDDYANEDRLSNFKQVAYITNTTPELVCLNLIAVKVARLSNLLENNLEPKNEAVNDSILDLVNYSALLHLIKNEKKD